MDENWFILIAVLGCFVAGFIDAVVGGGGLLQVPLLFILFPGYHHTHIIATNRFASVAGTVVSAFQYSKKVKVSTKAILIAGVAAAVSSFLGVMLMSHIPTKIFKPILLFVILLLVIYTFSKKELGQKENNMKFSSKMYTTIVMIGILLGLYNGVIGPGTGTLLVFSLVHFMQFSFLQSSAYSKIINAIADMASLITFFIQGAIMYKIALPMLVTNMLGSFMGSKMAIKKGNEYIRLFFIIVLAILILRFGWDIYTSK